MVLENGAGHGGEEQGGVLIVDDDDDFAASIDDILQSRGYRTRTARGGRDALEALADFDAQVALLDRRLGTNSGIELIPRLKAARPGMLCVMMTAYAALDTAIEALQRGAYDYLRKPLEARDLLATVSRCFERLRLEAEKKIAETDLALRNSELTQINARLREVVDTTKGLSVCSRVSEFGELLLTEFGRHMQASGGGLYLVESDGLHLMNALDPDHAPPPSSPSRYAKAAPSNGRSNAPSRC